MKMISVAIVTVIFLIARSPGLGIGTKTSGELIEYLFNTTRYDKRILPSVGTSLSLNVSLGLSVAQLEDLDEKQQLLISHIVITMQWRDPKLAWDPMSYGGLDYISIGAKKIWTPDIVLYNSIGSDRAGGMRRNNAIIHHSGKVTLKIPKIVETSCKTNVANYPFDKQKCRFKLGSWMYHGNDIALDSKVVGVDLSQYVKNGKWELEDVTSKINVVVYGCCPEPYYDITYFINLRRQVLYYAIYFLIPCALIALLAATIFVLPEDCSERITVGMCSLVGLSFFFLLVSENMPASSTLPLIGGYYSVTMIQMSVSFFMNIIVLRFHHMTEDKVPDWVRKYILGYGAALLQLKFKKLFKGGLKMEENAEECKAAGIIKGNDAIFLNEVLNKKNLPKEMIVSDQNIASVVLEEAERDQRDIDWKRAAHILNNLALSVHVIVVLLTFVAMFFEVIFIANS